MVDVITIHTIGDFYDQVMHVSILSLFFFAVCQRPHGINGIRSFVGVPFVFPWPMVILRVNDGKFPFCQRNLSEGIAKAHPAEDKQSRDFDADNQNQDAPSGDRWASELTN